MQLVRNFIFLLITFSCFSPFARSQPNIVSCPLDTHSHFQISIEYSKFLDSTGKIQIKTFAYAIPNWYLPEAFIHNQTGEPCTPFVVEFENDKIYIYDSTGHYPNYAHPDLANRFLLNQNNIIGLRIHIKNSTKESIDLNDLHFLNELNLPISYFEMDYMPYNNEAAVKINVKKWKFIRTKSLHDIRISLPIFESKKKLLRDLGRYESLEYIELRSTFNNK